MKKVNIKNYTSEAKADSSISKIERLLVDAGARNISKRYSDDGQAEGIAFAIPMNGMHLTFDLKSNIDAIYSKLYQSYSKPTSKSMQICREQAERTAWKILADWVEIQLTMIALEQIEDMQAFFPILTNGTQTFYERLKDNNFKQLLPESSR